MTDRPTISGRRLDAYLEATGWTRLRVGANGAVWSLAEQRSLLSPGQELDHEDRDELIQRAVSRLAEIENRSIADVFRDIMLADRDTLLVRIESPDLAHGEMPLRFGSEAFQGARELFTAAALAEHLPRARFGSFRPVPVLEVLDSTTFGQTYVGSYVISIRTRGAQQLSWADDPGAATLDRRAVSRALLGADAASRAPANAGVMDTIDDGVSFEMCSALSKLDPGGTGAAVELSAIWAPGLPQPSVAPLTAVRLEDAQLSHIREVRDYLAGFEPVELELVGGLTDVHVDFGGATGRIKLLAYTEGQMRPVHVDLAGRELERVRPLVGRASVRFAGRLEKVGRSWRLFEPRLLAVDEIELDDHDDQG
jgi:hypothetical protein